MLCNFFQRAYRWNHDVKWVNNSEGKSGAEAEPWRIFNFSEPFRKHCRQQLGFLLLNVYSLLWWQVQSCSSTTDENLAYININLAFWSSWADVMPTSIIFLTTS